MTDGVARSRSGSILQMVHAHPIPGAPRSEAIGRGAVAVAGFGGALLALSSAGVPVPPCPLRTLTGIPCPGCGMTRLADTLVAGEVTTAIHADPAGVALLVALGVIAVAHLVGRGADRRPPGWMRSPALPAVLLLLGAIHWMAGLLGGGAAAL